MDKNNNFKIKKGNHFHIINNFQSLILKNINMKKINYSSDRKKNNSSNSFKKSYKIKIQNITEKISKFRQEPYFCR